METCRTYQPWHNRRCTTPTASPILAAASIAASTSSIPT
jgi:hypothetical protein